MNLYVYILLQPKKPWVSQQNLESWRQAWPVYNLILVIIIKIDSPEERFLVHPDWRLQISLVVQSHSWFNTGKPTYQTSYLWQHKPQHANCIVKYTSTTTWHWRARGTAKVTWSLLKKLQYYLFCSCTINFWRKFCHNRYAIAIKQTCIV